MFPASGSPGDADGLPSQLRMRSKTASLPGTAIQELLLLLLHLFFGRLLLANQLGLGGAWLGERCSRLFDNYVRSNAVHHHQLRLIEQLRARGQWNLASMDRLIQVQIVDVDDNLFRYHARGALDIQLV